MNHLETIRNATVIFKVLHPLNDMFVGLCEFALWDWVKLGKESAFGHLQKRRRNSAGEKKDSIRVQNQVLFEETRDI